MDVLCVICNFLSLVRCDSAIDNKQENLTLRLIRIEITNVYTADVYNLIS